MGNFTRVQLVYSENLFPILMYGSLFEGKMPQNTIQLLEFTTITALSGMTRMGCIYMMHNRRKDKDEIKIEVKVLKSTETLVQSKRRYSEQHVELFVR